MQERHVFVLVDNATSHGRRILRGVLDRVRIQSRPWRVRWSATVQPQWLSGFDGLIGPFAAASVMPLVRELPRVPRVNVSSQRPARDGHSVLPDNAAIGRLAAEHLRARLHRSFAFCGIAAHRYSGERLNAFVEALGLDAVPVGEASTRGLSAWLGSLPPQTGIFAANDFVARQLLEVAASVGRRIPDELAVVGVDAEEEIGIASGVTLSSIDPDAHRIGFEAAALLEELLAGKPPAARERRVAPAGVVEGESTGGYAGDDEVLQRALGILRERFHDELSIDRLARETGVSRRTLEARFKASLGRAPGEELRRLRIGRACELLRSSTLSVGEIAERAGFRDVYYFSAAFRKATGQSPSAFRRG